MGVSSLERKRQIVITRLGLKLVNKYKENTLCIILLHIGMFLQQMNDILNIKFALCSVLILKVCCDKYLLETS